jgi:hypothetical protein
MSFESRREFFKKVFFYTSAGALVHVLAKSYSAEAAEPKLIDMTEKMRKDSDNKTCIGIATGLGYVEDLDKALKDKKIVKADKPGANNKVWKPTEQTCENCMFYNFKKESPAKSTCQLIPSCLIHKKGSCNTWTPKA